MRSFRAARTAGLVIVEATEREVVGGEKVGRREWDVVAGSWRLAARMRTNVSADDGSFGVC
jgi:hypothetical protein